MTQCNIRARVETEQKLKEKNKKNEKLHFAFDMLTFETAWQLC